MLANIRSVLSVFYSHITASAWRKSNSRFEKYRQDGCLILPISQFIQTNLQDLSLNITDNITVIQDNGTSRTAVVLSSRPRPLSKDYTNVLLACLNTVSADYMTSLPMSRCGFSLSSDEPSRRLQRTSLCTCCYATNKNLHYAG